MKYLFHIAYKGTNYHGWQRQDNTADTIQEVIEVALSRMSGVNCIIVGCGRTDSGVHASSFYFHLETNLEFETNQFVYKLNKMLPLDIVIYSCCIVSDQFHARFDATRRSYVYYLSLEKPIYYLDTCFYYPYVKSLDLEILNRFAKVLKDASDFYPFCKFGSDNKTTLCKIEECYWLFDSDKNIYEFHITSDRFLRGMIRLIVGASLNLEKGKLELEEIEKAMNQRSRLSTDWSVPPNGLFLNKVIYPE